MCHFNPLDASVAFGAGCHSQLGVQVRKSSAKMEKSIRVSKLFFFQALMWVKSMCSFQQHPKSFKTLVESPVWRISFDLTHSPVELQQQRNGIATCLD